MNKLIKKLFKYKGIRFLFVGGINTIVGYGSYAILLFFKINYLLANTLSTIIGVINSYIWNRNFTFKSEKNKKEELPKFIFVYLISYLVGLLVLYLLVTKLSLNKYIAGIINIFITTCISWFGHKYFSFKGE